MNFLLSGRFAERWWRRFIAGGGCRRYMSLVRESFLVVLVWRLTPLLRTTVCFQVTAGHGKWYLELVVRSGSWVLRSG